MIRKAIGGEVVDRIHLAECVCSDVPSVSIKR
jgi:hypothetical protein